ncbi:GGDEF domain-containing protein [Asticcacaulis sp. 201]|uniref:GGDEF domain-containing protein n=1 Tax=Asticcacaulis sp. 201 TaxID=3028787 RepID=UPI00291661AC|nr:diguanylate cyclase [Asticcacaulis sp. 201]MDV6329387.1 diguanylate cyclase [Asticcacaulis sp. 201]
MTLQARLLLLSRDESWLHTLGDELDCLGMRTLIARESEAAYAALADLPIEAVLVDETGQHDWKDIEPQLRAACSPRRIPVILMRQDDDYRVPDGWDMVFTRQAHAQQVVVSVEHLVRACIAEEEYDTRRETFKADLQDLDIVLENQDPLAILSIGQPDPEYLAITHSLREKGVDVTAALSSYSAFDYLHDKTFDAVLLWGGAQPSESLSIAAGMRRNTRLYHTPVLLRLNKLVEVDLGNAFMRGVNDIANPNAKVGEIADRLVRLARTHRRQLTIRKTLENMRHHAEMDKGTGLFGRDLFAAHLARLSKAATERHRTLSICVLKIAETPDVARARARKMLDKAVPQIGSMVARLVRAEDSGGRLSNDVFALALPATSLDAARSVGERISAVVSCTAFDSGQGKPPYVVEFIVGAAQIQDGEPAAAALTRAAAAVGNPDREAV